MLLSLTVLAEEGWGGSLMLINPSVHTVWWYSRPTVHPHAASLTAIDRDGAAELRGQPSESRGKRSMVWYINTNGRLSAGAGEPGGLECRLLMCTWSEAFNLRGPRWSWPCPLMCTGICGVDLHFRMTEGFQKKKCIWIQGKKKRSGSEFS